MENPTTGIQHSFSKAGSSTTHIWKKNLLQLDLQLFSRLAIIIRASNLLNRIYVTITEFSTVQILTYTSLKRLKTEQKINIKPLQASFTAVDYQKYFSRAWPTTLCICIASWTNWFFSSHRLFLFLSKSSLSYVHKGLCALFNLQQSSIFWASRGSKTMQYSHASWKWFWYFDSCFTMTCPLLQDYKRK